MKKTAKTSRTTKKRAPRTTLETRMANAAEILRLGNALKTERTIAQAKGDVGAEARTGSPVYEASIAFAKAVRNFK